LTLIDLGKFRAVRGVWAFNQPLMREEKRSLLIDLLNQGLQLLAGDLRGTGCPLLGLLKDNFHNTRFQLLEFALSLRRGI